MFVEQIYFTDILFLTMNPDNLYYTIKKFNQKQKKTSQFENFSNKNFKRFF